MAEQDNIEELQKLAEQGDAKAQKELAYLYLRGSVGLCRDGEKYLEWMTKVAEQGDAEAQFSLGFSFDKGADGVPQNQELSAKWFEMAAKQGYALAFWYIGDCYYSGKGVPKNYELAIAWLKKAAEGDCHYVDTRNAQCRLGEIYEHGYGVDVDLEIAAEWYSRAAKNNCSLAEDHLNRLYDSGLVKPKDVAILEDAKFGRLIHDRRDLWKGKLVSNQNGKDYELELQLEGFEIDNISNAQNKAFANYKKRKDELFVALQAKAKELYAGANGEEDNELIPQALFIGRKGDYGWVCEKAWNGDTVSAILSGEEIQLASEGVIYNYKDVISCKKRKSWEVGDIAYLNLWGQLTAVSVERADEDEFEDDELSRKEVKLLLWLMNEQNMEDVTDEVLSYCNDTYEEYSDTKITKQDLLDELDLGTIYLNTRFSKKIKDMPDISIAGECECDPDHGIAIGFRDMKFLGIGPEDYAGF